MSLVRKIGEHRPVVILVTLAGLSLVSLVSGTQSTFIHRGIYRAVSFTAYPFLEGKRRAETAVASVAGMFYNYNALAAENEALWQQLAERRSSLAGYSELQRENERLREMLDFVRKQPKLSLQPASVIESLQGMLTIDRGRIDGIERGMSVITAEGVVGVITEVYDLSAKVATLQHPDCKAGAMVMRNRKRAYDGVVHAGGDAGGWCTMYYIDIKDEVLEGDLVVASPESLFPAGYPIGKISAPPHSMGSLWKWAEVTPAVDPYVLDEIYVVRRVAPSPEDMAGPPPEPGAATVKATGPAKPEKKPAEHAPPIEAPALQERYAP